MSDNNFFNKSESNDGDSQGSQEHNGSNLTPLMKGYSTTSSNDDQNGSRDGNREEGFIAKLRGLPWSVTTDEIINFLDGCTILNDKNGIHLTQTREGRASGEAYVELETEEDLEKALDRDHQNIGSRYIEVFKADRTEMDWVLKRRGVNDGDDDGVVRLRGLPYGCSKEEIAQFFTGLEIKPNGITFLINYAGRSTGEAFVQFANRDVAEKALQKHREKIGHRYIEIFRSNLMEVQKFLWALNSGFGSGGGNAGGNGGNNSSGGGGGGPLRNTPLGMGYGGMRPSPYDRNERGMNRYGGGMGGGSRGMGNNSSGPNRYFDFSMDSVWNNSGGFGMDDNKGPRPLLNEFSNNRGGDSDNNSHCVHMRGLPFRATEADVLNFFKPLIPVNINLLNDKNGRRSGEADVEFSSHPDAVSAMEKDKSNMGHRYIELFLNSSANKNNWQDW